MQEFNQGVYDYIIATDESGRQVEYDTDDDANEDEEEEECQYIFPPTSPPVTHCS